MGLLGATFPKICDPYPTMIKLGTFITYLKKIQKIYKSRDTHLKLSRLTSGFFSSEISNFCYIKKNRYRLHFNTYFLILLTFFEPLKVVLINMIVILMMPANLATLGHLKMFFEIKVMTS